ncbi:GPW/gp25 family protein [Pasteurella multocida]|uniref:GPW/gp25 family protein n=1 Tax=Pasteurella multocida TaxID=747 RepID=UPI003978BFFC
MNRYTGETVKDELSHIKQSISDILITPIGTRIQRRDYGSQIPPLLANPINHALLLQLSSAAVMALTKWEPRIQITAFKPKVEESKITATLVARRTDTQKQFELNDIFLGGKQ